MTSDNKETGDRTVNGSKSCTLDGIDQLDAKFTQLISFARTTYKQRCSALKYDPGDEYLMDHKRRGKCIIFNHRHFDEKTLNERKGTELDAYALKRCFTEFGFEVKAYDDLTVAEILAMLKALAKEDHGDADCFVCCVMTHGDQANLWAKNDKYPIDLLFNPFTADSCSTLTGKPKLFFIQACRGDRLDPGVVLKIGTDDIDSAKYYTIPTWADFLIAYSTVPGYYSWRNTRDGSWFMQSLVEVMLTEASQLSFLDVITKVNKKVAYDYISSVPNDKEYDKQKQVPSTIHMLTRRLVLRPKNGSKKETGPSANEISQTNKIPENCKQSAEACKQLQNLKIQTKSSQKVQPGQQSIQQPQQQPTTIQVTGDLKI